MLEWLISWLVKMLGERAVSWLGSGHDVRLTAHRAVFLPTGEPCVFVTATNRHRTREAVVTHAWFDVPGPRHVPILNPQRPLPKRLRPDEPWETWIPDRLLPPGLGDDVLRMAYVRLSTRLVVSSVPNTDVPPAGFVPGP
jgi:hypothetical protein